MLGIIVEAEGDAAGVLMASSIPSLVTADGYTMEGVMLQMTVVEPYFASAEGDGSQFGRSAFEWAEPDVVVARADSLEDAMGPKFTSTLAGNSRGLREDEGLASCARCWLR